MNLSIPWPEIALGLVSLLAVVNAARRGFLREGSLLVGLALALWLAGQLYRPAGLLLLRQPERGGPWSLALYLGVAAVLLVVLVGASALAAPLVRRGPLLGLDRLGGLAVGVVEATLLAGVLGMAGERFGLLTAPPGGPVARAAELTVASLVWLAAAVPPDVLRLLPVANSPR